MGLPAVGLSASLAGLGVNLIFRFQIPPRIQTQKIGSPAG